MAVHDIAGRTLVENDRRRITVSRPRNDGHNRSALAIETTGHIDVVVGTRVCVPVLRSGQPLNIGTFPTVPMTTMPELDPDVCRFEEGKSTKLGQTYVSLVRDRFDTLHLSIASTTPSRTSPTSAGSLAAPGRPRRRSWTRRIRTTASTTSSSPSTTAAGSTSRSAGPLQNCIEPAVSCAPPGSWFGPAQLFKYSSLLVSSNGGNSWQLGSTPLFGDATFWEPASGALADLDGNGLKDVVQSTGTRFEVHVDAAQVLDGVWQWVTRGRRLPDGAQILERPVLSGNVNAPADDRDDLVYVYGDPARKIRTQLARADGGIRRGDAARWHVRARPRVSAADGRRHRRLGAQTS